MSGLSRSSGVLLLMLATGASAQNAQDQLKKARTLATQNKFAPALKLVEKAMLEPGNDLETTLELLELSGVCNAALKKPAPAKLAFQKLLSLAPTYVLNRSGPPIVFQAFADAKAGAETLNIQPSAPEMSNGKINDVAVEVTADPFKLAKTVLFNYRAIGGKWHTRAVPVTIGRVAAKVDGADKIEWYATVLGANDAEVLRIRTVDSPITHTYRAPSPAKSDAPVASTDNLTPVRIPEPVQVIEPSGPRKKGWVAPVAWTLIGAGVAAGGVGTFFGFEAQSARNQFSTATNTSEVVVGLTRARAIELDSQNRTDAALANTLWVSAGVLVATGLLLRLAGPTEAPQ